MASNGRLPASHLTPVPPGKLEKNAARAWRAGPGKAGCKLLGPNSGYRSLGMQSHYWGLYQSGRGNLAARPGTSNHGWGRAVDLAAPWMRTWIDRNGGRYGWRKTEAMSEWWHVNYVGGYKAPKPKPNPLRHLGPKQRKAADKLLYHRRERAREAKSGKGARYKRHDRAARKARDQLIGYRRHAGPTQKRVIDRVLKDRNGRL
jgi:hypothetical protein